MTHIPVLLHEVVNALSIEPTDVVLDATLGQAGHAKVLGEQLSASGVLIGIDADTHALTAAQKNLGNLSCKKILEKRNFADIESFLVGHNINRIDKALFDLGWGTHTLETGRGFSFQNSSEPLLMTYDDSPAEDAVTAADIVNHWSEDTLVLILKKYGGEGRARAIARAIVASRSEKPFETVGDLVSCVASVVPKHSKINPATKTFQALRIAVNNELGIIAPALDAVRSRLSDSGKLAVITFHSTEDTIVKQCFRQWVEDGYGTLLTKHVIKPSRAEELSNPRSRSAQLRVFVSTTSSKNNSKSQSTKKL